MPPQPFRLPNRGRGKAPLPHGAFPHGGLNTPIGGRTPIHAPIDPSLPKPIRGPGDAIGRPELQKQTGPNSVGRFNRIYNRPGVIKQGIASGSLVGPAAIKELAQARQARKGLSQSIIKGQGGQQSFENKAGYQGSGLKTALRTARTAQTQTQAGTMPSELSNTPLVQRAKSIRSSDLAARRKTLLSAYLNKGDTSQPAKAVSSRVGGPSSSIDFARGRKRARRAPVRVPGRPL